MGAPEDTLLEEHRLIADNSAVVNEILIDNAPYDAAGFKVKKTCPKCKLDYMTRLILDDGSRVVYRCDCGNQIDRHS